MQINPVATELTTAATDLLLTLAALFSALYLRRFRRLDGWKSTLWLVVLGALAVGSGVAAAAHGLVVPAQWLGWLWGLIYLALGIVVSGIAVAAVYDLKGVAMARRAIWVMGVLVLLFLLLVKLVGGDFRPFIIFEGLAMLMALSFYAYLALVRGRRDARWMSAGIATTLVAALMQLLHLGAFVWIWPFDHNGAFHLVQLPGLLFIVLGLRAWFRGERRVNNRP